MATTIQKWGNSQGLRLSKELLHEGRIELGDAVDVTFRDGVIVIAPVKRRRVSHSLDELVSRISKTHRAEETEWGAPVGAEEW